MILLKGQEDCSTQRKLKELESAKGTIPGKMLIELDKLANPQNVLIFGCGNSPLGNLVSRCFSIPTLCYDSDPKKIIQVKNKANQAGNVSYTSESPTSQFDAVLSIAVLHHNPERIADEMINLTNPQGIIGTIDYDVVCMPIKKFFETWGKVQAEREERKILGDIESHRIHTSFGLAECLSLMEARRVQTLFYQGNISMFNETKHFIYFGRVNGNL